jgi:hypothetical protein
MTVRDYLSKTLQVIEGKENQLYDTLIHDYGLPLKRHGETSVLLDLVGLSSGDIAFDNLSIVEAQIERGHQNAQQLGEIRGWLHAYMGVKAKIFEIETELKEQYSNLVAKTEDETALANNEFRQLATAKENYQNTFSRFGVDEWAKTEYDAFIGTLNEVANGKAKSLIGEF